MSKKQKPDDYAFANGGWKVPTMEYVSRLEERIEALEGQTAQQRIKREGFSKSKVQEIIDSEPEILLETEHVKVMAPTDGTPVIAPEELSALLEEDIDEIPMEDGGGYALEDLTNDEIGDILLGGEDCSHCESKSAGDEAGESPADDIRQEYEVVNCFYTPRKREFGEIEWDGDINLNSESLKLWQVLLLMQEEGFTFEDFEWTLPGCYPRQPLKNIENLHTCEDVQFRFRWTRESRA